MTQTQAWRDICKLFPQIYASQAMQIRKIVQALEETSHAQGYHRGIKTRSEQKKVKDYHEMLNLQ
jgi:hypothetical protein